MAGITGFYHAGVTVRDMAEALRFYRDSLGLEVESEGLRSGEQVAPILGLELEALVSVMLRVPGSDVRVELFEYRGIERHSASSRPCDYGGGHFCLYVDDADEVHRRLVANGFSSRSPVISITR